MEICITTCAREFNKMWDQGVLFTFIDNDDNKRYEKEIYSGSVNFWILEDGGQPSWFLEQINNWLLLNGERIKNRLENVTTQESYIQAVLEIEKF